MTHENRFAYAGEGNTYPDTQNKNCKPAMLICSPATVNKLSVQNSYDYSTGDPHKTVNR